MTAVAKKNWRHWRVSMASGCWRGRCFCGQRHDKLVNRGVLLPGGQIIASYDKIHMFDANVGDGQRYCRSDSFAASATPVIADLGDIKLGMTICYDLRFPHLYRQLLPMAHISGGSGRLYCGGAAQWHVLLRARAIETGCYVIAPPNAARIAMAARLMVTP